MKNQSNQIRSGLKRLLTIIITPLVIFAIHSCKKDEGAAPLNKQNQYQAEGNTGLAAQIEGIYRGTLQVNCPGGGYCYDTSAGVCMVRVTKIDSLTILIQPYNTTNGRTDSAQLSQAGNLINLTIPEQNMSAPYYFLTGDPGGTFDPASQTLSISLRVTFGCFFGTETFQGVKQNIAVPQPSQKSTEPLSY